MGAQLRLVPSVKDHFPPSHVRRSTSSKPLPLGLLPPLPLPLSWHRPRIAGRRRSSKAIEPSTRPRSVIICQTGPRRPWFASRLTCGIRPGMAFCLSPTNSAAAPPGAGWIRVCGGGGAADPGDARVEPVGLPEPETVPRDAPAPLPRPASSAAVKPPLPRRPPFGGRVPSALPSRLEPRLLSPTLPCCTRRLDPSDGLLDQRPN